MPAGLRAAVRRTLGLPAVRAGSVFQQAKLTASDAAAGDLFSRSVAIYGSTAVVGAPNKNNGTGAAYVFVRSGTIWSQQAKLTASDGVAGDNFGNSVAIYGSTAVIGDWNYSGVGAAYVFVRSGATWSQQAKLIASDASPYDEFGYSVAIYGSTAVVGAYDSGLSGIGAAYVFVRSGTAWSQQAKLTASDAAANEQFGDSVAMYGSTVVVGAPTKDSGTGAVYVFVRSGATWPQQAKLTASDAAANDYFGYSVALSGSTVVVGADGNNSGTGAAYVFVRSGSTWSQQAELTAPDGAAGDRFGESVAISGSTAVVGAHGKNSLTGAAYVFVRSGTAWPQQSEPTASDAAAGDAFGYSVAISGSTAVVGAPNKNSATGAAYVFVLPSQQAELTPSDRASGDNFGLSVAISGSIAVVGAPIKNSQTGAAYVFARSGSGWSQQAELTASDAGAGDYFGFSVAVSGTTVVVGAYGKSSSIGPGTGAAYVFVQSGTSWSQQAKLTASDAAPYDRFGIAVAISGSAAVIGAYSKNTFAGAAYVFVRSGTVWSQQAELTAADAAQGDSFGGSVAISGSTALIGAYGKSSSTGAGTGAAYVFVGSGTAWSQQAKLTASDAAAGDSFGDSVAISGSTAVVGAYGKNSATGAAYVFAASGTSWAQRAELTASDAVAGDEFGVSVAISRSTVVIGARYKDANAGVAYVFAPSASSWPEQAELTASDAAAGDEFGLSVAVSGSNAVIGAPYKNSGTGAAYVFANV